MMEYLSLIITLSLTALGGFLVGRFTKPTGLSDQSWCSIDLNGQSLPSGGLVDALLIVDGNSGRILFGDERAAQFYGLPSKDLKGKKYSEMLGDAPRHSPFLAGQHFRQTHFDRGGNELPVEVTSCSVRYKGKDAVLVCVRGSREKSHKEKEADIRKAAIDATYNGVGILSKDREGCPLVDANPSLFKALEMPEEKVIGAPFLELLPDQGVRREIQEKILEGKGWKGELRVDDGRGERWFFMSIDPMELSEGEEGFLAVVCQDITENRMAENRLVDAIVQTQQQERKRVANDLHDGVGQTLTAANVYLKTMEKKWRKGQAEEGMEHLPMVSDLVYKGVEEIRNISHDLMPDTLKEYGLIRAIRQLIREVDEGSEAIELRFHTALNPEMRRNESLEGGMYRVCQEIINNSLRHSEATRIDLKLKENDQDLILEAEDNGKGFDPSRIEKGEGLGLSGMKDRVRSLNGTVEIDGKPGKGAFFRVRLPHFQEEQIWEKSTPLD